MSIYYWYLYLILDSPSLSVSLTIVNMNYSTDLADTSSEAFRNLQTQVCDVVDTIYTDKPDKYKDCRIIKAE